MFQLLLPQSKRVDAPKLHTELLALAISSVRDYTLLGGPSADRLAWNCTGLYAWDSSAPQGTFTETLLSPADQQTVLNAIAAHVDTTATDATTLRTAVQTQLAGIPGTAWTALTAAQKQAVIVALLYKIGALDKTLIVQPLASWL